MITAAAIQKTIEFWETQWTDLEVLDDTETESVKKTAIVETETGFLRSTAFFPHDQANFHIEKVKTYAGAVLVAENDVDIIKTEYHSLTLIRKDHLEGI